MEVVDAASVVDLELVVQGRPDSLVALVAVKTIQPSCREGLNSHRVCIYVVVPRVYSIYSGCAVIIVNDRSAILAVLAVNKSKTRFYIIATIACIWMREQLQIHGFP